MPMQYCFWFLGSLLIIYGERAASSEDNVTTFRLLHSNEQIKPHIIFILADDLGFNDVGFHGSAQIPTPNIDALAYSGIILNQYYVNPICTPSRSALMTGKYPIHTGMQHTVLYAAEPRGLPLNEKLMPEYFNQLGYSSHIAGKWHLGHYKHAYTPLYRGFRSHVGFWTGHHDYFDHTAVENPSWGLDIRKGLNIAYDLHGKHTTDLITEESVRVIAAHNATKQPLFLYVAHAAVHSGNPYNPLPVPDNIVGKMEHIEHFGRRKYAAMVSKLDQSVGQIVQQLKLSNMLNDSIIIFSTDNGGPAEGFNLNHASNWPLRGVKNTLWEGGVRGAALLWYPKLNKKSRVSNQTIHITDWLPTLLDAIGGNEALKLVKHANLDGISIWNALSNDIISPRTNLLHNIDEIWGSSAVTIGNWKLLNGTHYGGAWDGWYGPEGIREPAVYDRNTVRKSIAGRAISSLNLMPSNAKIIRLRQAATVSCGNVFNSSEAMQCEPLKSMCLFNIKDDPCEHRNLAEVYPEILNSLLIELKKFKRSAIPPSNKPLDPRADPRLWQNTWSNFGDYEIGIYNEAVVGNLR